MRALWTSEEALTATGGKGTADWQASRVVIDSRTVQAGDLFIALKGESFDGHDYVKEAFAKGAAAALVAHVPDGCADKPLLVVKDTFVALRKLAAFARSRSRAKVIGVTGSVGKTGMKEALRTMLQEFGQVHATSGNLNNHIGLPLSLANLPAPADFAVFEMGMNHAGEIRELTLQAKPDIAIITNVEAVHLEFFDSVEGIADAKSEIFAGMDKDGIVVLNADNPHYTRLKYNATRAGLARIQSFGMGAEVNARLHACATSEGGSEVLASINGTRVGYKTGTIGKHWGLTATAALCIADALGLDLAKAAAAFAHFTEPEGRGKARLMSLVTGAKITLIDDSYNASPASVNAALEKLRELKQRQSGRTVAVLGDMLELGISSAELHVGLMPSLINNQIDVVFTAGSFMKKLYDALPDSMKGDYAADAATLAPKVVRSLKNKDIVLVKGSNGSRMKDVVKAIMAESTEDKNAL